LLKALPDEDYERLGQHLRPRAVRRRGRVEVVDRAGLESAACECYAVTREVYDRLLP
jgi:hypothetical protein